MILVFPREWGLLHARGGVSKLFKINFIRCLSSPRSWRCFKDIVQDCEKSAVFSTLVEVFLD